jgi:hypothetical protein
MRCFEECGLSQLPWLLLDLSIMRLVEPASKLRSIELLQHYFDIRYSQRIYRNIPKLTDYKAEIERCAYKVAQEKFNEPFNFVLYDVTTLYFESFKADDFKTHGFLKYNKSQQPQIVIGLLVTQSGYPLLYQVFAGNTFEGKTMLPVLESFISTHPQARPIIVADAAMLDDERLTELRQKGLSYIVGARLPNANPGLVKKINATLNGNHGTMARFPSRHGDLVCDFSLKRYKKELIELNKLIQKAEELVAKQELKVKVRFIRKVAKEKIELNTELIEKRRLLLGIKGYCTDLPEKLLSNEMVFERYHHLWHIKQSFYGKQNLKIKSFIGTSENAVLIQIWSALITILLLSVLKTKALYKWHMSNMVGFIR